jgi:ketosteroid isomerase-like protein
VVEAFYQAYCTRDPDRIGMYLDDDVEWVVEGPVEVISFYGTWRGKAAVLDRFRRIVPQVTDFKKLDIDALLVDGESSAMFGRITSVQRKTGRLISHRCAHLVRYRAGKVFYLRVLTDNLDAVEQFLGHRIDLTSDPDDRAGDLIAV